jgi:RHS repeat-associated protein
MRERSEGRRVSKVGSKLYWYGSGGDILAETTASGTTTAEYIFFGGKRIAMLPASSTPIYYVEDMLGTSRVITTNTGAVCYDADFYPYGGERPYTNSCAQNYKFEGKERDTETGNDDFGARYYSNRFGRWLSADWSSVPVPVPYANLTNPQTLNLYAMVADDPESFADLDGHDGIGVWDVVDFVVGALNAYASDNLAGAGRQQQDTTAGKLGAATGDLAATIQGGEEALAGGAGVTTGVSLSATGEGAIIGVPLTVVSAPVAAHGFVTATEGAGHLGAAAADAIKGATQKSGNKDQSSSGAKQDKPDTRATKAEKNTLEGAQDQADSISKAKEKLNKTGQGDKIQSTKKSEQRLKNQLKKIQSLKDVED